MKKNLFILLFLGASNTFMYGQRYFSKTGHIDFLSVASIETIAADNDNTFAVFDFGTGQFEFSVLIKGFKFEKAVMQEHFNENYMESDKYPKSIFKGSILNMADIHFDVDHTYQINIAGQLTIREITKPFMCPAKLVLKGGVVTAIATFDINIADYDIQIPRVVSGNISKKVKVNVSVDLHPMN